MENKNSRFTITNTNGEELECDVLFTFDDEKLKKSYIVFTDNNRKVIIQNQDRIFFIMGKITITRLITQITYK